jgi:hypothetical protein
MANLFVQPIEEAFKRFIRHQRVYRPLISHGALVENVSKRLNREFDQRYVKKLTDNKIERQMLIEVDRTKIERRNGFHARKLSNGPRPHQSRYRPRPLASWFVSQGRF